MLRHPLVPLPDPAQPMVHPIVTPTLAGPIVNLSYSDPAVLRVPS